jgi:hypothetical protein
MMRIVLAFIGASLLITAPRQANPDYALTVKN